MSGTTSASSNLLPAGFLSTSGNQIVDSSGSSVIIKSVNWSGIETVGQAPGGLEYQSYKTMMNQMVQLGFNTIRLPFSLQALSASTKPASWAINTQLNPDLAGMNSLQVMNQIISYAGQIGLKVILDDHSSATGGGPNPNGLWYDSGYTDAQWTADWTKLAQTYATNPTVIGADLSNEPHGQATWGDGNIATDWQAAATRAGDAIQTVNPNWLIFVEGVQNANGVSTMWGENLTGVAAHPVTLTVPGKVVYSPHDYPQSVSTEPYFQASNYPNNLPSVWTQDWGYIYQQNIAPIFLGEFGSKLQTSSDQQWMSQLQTYLDGGVGGTNGGSGISWSYWDWNPDSNDTGGILTSNWSTPDATKLTAIAGLLAAKPQNPTIAAASTATAITASSVEASIVAATSTMPTGPGYQTPLNLGNGPATTAVSGLGCIITGGDGNITVGHGTSVPLGNAWIKLGSGNDSVIAFGTNNVVSCENGNNSVVGMQGNAKVALGNGDNVVVAFGAGNAISIGDTAAPASSSDLSFVNGGGGGSTVITGNGDFYILESGARNVITTGSSASAFIMEQAADPATDGHSTITTGSGNNWIVLAGTGNVVNTGAGVNVIYGSGGSDVFRLQAGGTDFIYGAAVKSGDTLDLSALLAGTHVTNDLTTLGAFVQVKTTGNDASVFVDPTGSGSFGGNAAAVLFGDAGLSLQQMQSAGMLKLSQHVL